MRYLMVGNGRVGANMTAYLHAFGHEVAPLRRTKTPAQEDAAASAIREADIIMVAIPDGAIADWFDQWREIIGKRAVIHFSGALTVAGMHGFHPLYSFPKGVLPTYEMEKIPFACSPEGPSFTEIFPGAPNKSFMVSDDERARYHALAVISGNFVSYIWNETAKELDGYAGEGESGLLLPYIDSIVARFQENPYASLTGPVARHDRATIDANLNALESDPKLKALYEAFVDIAWPEYHDEP